VRFDAYSSDLDVGRPGTLLDATDERLAPLPRLCAVVRTASGARGEIDVRLEAELSAVGTLELSAVPRDQPRIRGKDGPSVERHRLTFELRASDEEAPRSSMPPASRARLGGLDDALGEITRVFGKGTVSEARDAKALVRELERRLGDRETWTADVARSLGDRLLEHGKGRKRTLDHERVYFQLTGFCLRPGVGAPGDEERMRAFAPLFAERLAFAKEARGWQQFLIAMRRAAAGLGEHVQRSMRDDLDPFVAPAEANLKKPRGPKPESCEPELLDLLGHLERVPAERRAKLGGWILERTWTRRDPRLWAVLGRLGARVPAYASVHHVIAPRVAAEWLDHLLREKWADLPTAARAASELARKTGDRARDVPEALQREVERRLEREGADRELVRVVREATEVTSEERMQFFGERLPTGLRLGASE
jgi:hypothetical protein